MWNKLIALLLLGILFSSKTSATVTLTGCQSGDVCAGVDVSYTCTADTENIQIVLIDTDSNAVLDVVFNETDALGNAQSETVVDSVNVWYNKTSDMSVRVWFTADVALDGFRFECRDIENETDIETSNCTIGVNSALARPVSFGLDDMMYCDLANFTWGVMGDETCLKDFVFQTTPAGSNNDTLYVIHKEIRYYDDLTILAINDTEYCVSVASRNYMTTSEFSGPLCVKYDVPLDPRGLRESYDVTDVDDDGDLTVTVRWMAPDGSRPYVMNYYISSNITDNDNDDGSGSGSDEDDSNEFVTRMISDGDRTMMMLHGAREGYYYTVSLWAENCQGNSSMSTISFRVTAPIVPTSTSSSTSMPTATVSPSASPTDDDDDGEVLPTYAIIIIAVVGALFLFFLIFLPIIICCCLCGGVACCVGCCAVCGESKKAPYDMEMGSHGTKL